MWNCYGNLRKTFNNLDRTTYWQNIEEVRASYALWTFYSASHWFSMSPLEGENQWKLYYYTCKWCLFLGTVASHFIKSKDFFVLVFSKSSGQTRSPFVQSLRRIAAVWNTEFQNSWWRYFFPLTVALSGLLQRLSKRWKRLWRNFLVEENTFQFLVESRV